MAKPLANFEELFERARAVGPRGLAVAAAHELHVLEAVAGARDMGLVNATVVGDQHLIEQVAVEHAIDLHGLRIVDEHDGREAAKKAVALVKSGEAEILMKGKLETADLLRAALDREVGLRTGNMLTGVFIMQVPGYDRLLYVSDPAIIIKPTLEQKVAITQNAIDVARKLGVDEPRVAVLAALELINPAMPSTVDAANLSKMADRSQIKGGLVDGPLSLDNAISPEAVRQSNLRSAVAGRADVLIVPHIEAGNMLMKCLTYFAGAVGAGIVIGAKAPIIVTSRADERETKLASIALGVVLASETAAA